MLKVRSRSQVVIADNGVLWAVGKAFDFKKKFFVCCNGMCDIIDISRIPDVRNRIANSSRALNAVNFMEWVIL